MGGEERISSPEQRVFGREGLGLEDVVRVGLFFTAFGWAGRQLMGSLLKTSARA